MSADARDVEEELGALRRRLADESVAPSSAAEAVHAPPAVAFSAGFADRVMERLHQSPASLSLGDGMQRVFRRLAPLTAAAVLFLAAFNLVDSRASDLTVTERVLGLPAVTLASALAVDAALPTWGP